ncbi:MAG: cupredoxin domain-containing protein [Anaerolineales bacterium]
MKDFRLASMLVLMLAGLLLAACAGSATPSPVTITLDMAEYTFTPDTIEVKVGQPVTIEMVNNGALEHELMIGRNVAMMDGRPSGFEHDLFAEAGIEPNVVGGMMKMAEDGAHTDEESHMHEGFMVALPKTGDKATLSFTATKEMLGEWEMGCFEQDGVHYDAGMKGTFIVSE